MKAKIQWVNDATDIEEEKKKEVLEALDALQKAQNALYAQSMVNSGLSGRM